MHQRSGINCESLFLQVKKSLCVLLQHQLASHQAKKPAALYRLDTRSVLLRVQYPRWIHAAKMLFGDAGELIVEDILQQGHTSKDQVGSFRWRSPSPICLVAMGDESSLCRQ